MELLPPRIGDRELFRLLTDILAAEMKPATAGEIRLRLMHKGFSWQSLIDLANGQDVLVPTIRALTLCGLLLPVPRTSGTKGQSHVTARLRDIYVQHLARQQLERGQLTGVVGVLDAAGITPLILKGARYLVAPAGSWSEARTIRDIDILVRREDGDRAIAALQDAGYRYDPGEELQFHHFPPMRCAGEPVTLEIHTDALADVGQRFLSTAHVWSQARKIDGSSFLVMPIVWQAVHCLLHHQISDHGYGRRILAVRALWEWAMLSRGFSHDDWHTIESHMQAANAPDVLGSWLMQTHLLFGVEIPAFIAISPDAHANAEATLRLASAPHWRRRARFIGDQLRFSFARDTLAMRYGIPPSQVSVVDAGRYLGHLVRRHRGAMFRRLVGYRDRMS